MARLLPCPGCERHIRITESLCPFCGEALPLSYQSAGPAPLPPTRLGRAAKFAFGAAVAGTFAVTGCGDDGRPLDTGTGGDTSIGVDSAIGDGGGDAMMDSGPVPLYGAPADSGGDAAGDASGDAVMDSGGGMALYGAAPADSGTTDAA